MGKINEEKIFSAAQKVLIESGEDGLYITSIAKALNVSHTALYKYFKNKDSLVEALIYNWISKIDNPILKQAVRVPEDEKINNLHDWMQSLVEKRQIAFKSCPEMTQLYLKIISQQTKILTDELIKFADKIEYMMSWDTFRKQRGITIMMSFTYFYHPYFMNKWDDNLTVTLFESTWLELLPLFK